MYFDRKVRNTKEMLINSLCGKIINDLQGLPVGRLAHGAQEPRHIQKYVEVTNPDISYPAPRGMSAMAIRPHSELISVSLSVLRKIVEKKKERSLI